MSTAKRSVPRIGCALLAAGSSQRLGQPKQLLSFRGKPLVRHIAEVLLAARCDEAAIVLGCHADEVSLAVSGLALDPLLNVEHREGVAASIRAAADWATERGIDALLFAACDQVRLSAEHVEQLIASYAGATDIVASEYAGTQGIPALFGSAWFPRLQKLHGDRGAGALLRAYSATRVVAWPDGELDIDTRRDLAHLH